MGYFYRHYGKKYYIFTGRSGSGLYFGFALISPFPLSSATTPLEARTLAKPSQFLSDPL
jgi:hypothetical protein